MVPHGRLGIEEVRVRLLRSGQRLQLRAGAGTVVMRCAGSIRIAQASNLKAERHILVAEERFVFDVGGVAWLTAPDGMNGEWLEETAMVLISVSASLP